MFLFLLNKDLGAESLGNMVSICLTFKDLYYVILCIETYDEFLQPSVLSLFYFSQSNGDVE